MRNSIIIVSAFVLLVSLLITLNLIFQNSLLNELTEQFNKQQLLIAKSISSNIETAIDREINKLRFLSRLFSQYSIKDKEIIRKITEESLGQNEVMKVNATVFNDTGDVFFTTSPSPASRDNNVEYFNKTKTLAESEIGVYHDNTRIFIIAPVYSESNFIGAVLFEIPIEALATMFLNPFKSKEKGYAWMMDEKGYLLYHPTEPDMIGNNLYSAKKECFKCHYSFELEKRVLESPVIEYGRYIAPTKEDKVLAFSRLYIGKISWIVSVSSPYSEVISITEKSMNIYSVLVVSIFTTVFLGASFVVFTTRRRVKTEIASKEAILLEKQKLDTIVSAIGSGLMLINNEHKITWVNKILREWAGDVEGKDFKDVFPSLIPKPIPDTIAHETIAGLFEKKESISQITSAPVRNKDAKIVGALILIQDVTEIKKLEESIIRSEKLAALGRLSAGISHEIGNPLTSISSFVQILKEKADDDFTKDSLQTIHHHIIRISEIVRQMSGFAKLPEMEIKQCNINHIIESTLDIVKYDKKLNHTKIIKKLADNLPPVNVDENYLSQIFINLMLNAADAIRDEKGVITIKSFLDNNSVIVQFEDTGIGIPKESLNKIFDPFFTTKEKGSGLGLSISSEIIIKLGGELRVESQEGTGSTFSVILPAKDLE